MKLFCSYLPGQENPDPKNQISGSKDLVFLHGFLGSGSNLRFFAKRFTSEGYHVYLPDLRNHGQSFHSDKMDYPTLAQDVLQLLKEKSLDKVILCGHSMGGKVAMQFALNYSEKVEKLIVLDIGPEATDIREMRKIVGILFAINLEKYNSRDEVKNLILKKLPHPVLVDFLLKNLVLFPEKKWKHNINLLSQNLDFLGKSISFPHFLEMPTLFVGGQESEYITHSTKNKIHQYFKNVAIEMIENAGHWLHYQQPDYLFKTILAFLKHNKNINLNINTVDK